MPEFVGIGAHGAAGQDEYTPGLECRRQDGDQVGEVFSAGEHDMRSFLAATRAHRAALDLELFETLCAQSMAPGWRVTNQVVMGSP